MCLATLLLQPDLPRLILLDEPELGLHPAAIQVLASLLRAASQRSQILLATQSVTLINQFDPEDVVVADRQDGGTTFTRLSSETFSNWLDEYSIGELWEKNLIGGRP
jgi:predicted ATPase